MAAPEPQRDLSGDDGPVLKDAAYYAEVREAVGRGAPTLLLGTSTRSLKRSLERLKAARQPSGAKGPGIQSGVLGEILKDVGADVAAREAMTPLEQVIEMARHASPPRDSLAMLHKENVAIIAEVRRASPSEGAMVAIADPVALAREYEAGGASFISVLTELRHFGGSLADLAAVREAVGVPVLYKDFVVSSYQLWEARAYGADMVLLIVAALDQNALVSLVERAASIGLVALVEAHNETEVVRAVDAGAKVIGINARDLATLQVDRGAFLRLAPLIPEDVVKIAESGIRGPHDLLAYAAAGADAVLVGEGLAIDKEPRAAVLVGEGLAIDKDPRAAIASLVTAGTTTRGDHDHP